MEKNRPDQEILNYLDGLLDPKQSRELEEQLNQSPTMRARMEELRTLHVALRAGARLEVPSRNFTERVMRKLDSAHVIQGFSPRNGLLLLGGILVAVGIGLILLEAGKYDGLSGTIGLDTLPVKKDWIKNTIPAIHLNGKLVVKIIMMVATGISLVLLDRTILRPMFQRRSGVI